MPTASTPDLYGKSSSDRLQRAQGCTLSPSNTHQQLAHPFTMPVFSANEVDFCPDFSSNVHFHSTIRHGSAIRTSGKVIWMENGLIVFYGLFPSSGFIIIILMR